MIKIVNAIMDNPIEINEGDCFNLVVESPAFFTKLLLDLTKEIEEKEESNFLIISEEKEIDIQKNLYIFIDYFKKIENDRKVINAIYKEIEKLIIDNYFEKINDINVELLKILEDAKFEINYPIDFEVDFDIINILKMYKVVPRISDNNLLNCLLDQINLLVNIIGKRIFIMVNIENYLIGNDIKQLIDYCKYNKINFVFLSSKKIEGIDISYKIIDEDLCEVVDK
ncbi:MAG: type II-A CRISPR-associated protein Csn2 [Clostridia bacterium]